MTPQPHTAESGTPLGEAITYAQTELGRVDVKAGTLLGLDGVLLVLIGSDLLLTQLQGAAAVLGWLAVAFFAGSAIALLIAIYPRLPRLPGSLADQAAMTAKQAVDTFADRQGLAEARAAQLPGIAGLTLTKYRVIRTSIWPKAAGFLFLVLALAVQLLLQLKF